MTRIIGQKYGSGLTCWSHETPSTMLNLLELTRAKAYKI